MITPDTSLTIEILLAMLIVSTVSAFWYYTYNRYPNIIEWREFWSNGVNKCQIPERALFTPRGQHPLLPEPGLHIQTYASTKSATSLLEAVECTAETYDDALKKEQAESSESLTTAEVRIQKRTVGVFIGKLGSNIKQIQKESNTLMHLNDEVLENGDRICVIRGSKACVDLGAEIVAKFLESLPIVVFKEVLVPKNAVGRIIGLDGIGIRSIEERSRAVVYVDMKREAQNNEKKYCRFAVLKGTKEQIEKAEEIIMAEIQEEESSISSMKMRSSGSTISDANSNKVGGSMLLKPLMSSMSNELNEPFQQPYLELNRKVEVFVSCVYHPNMFWIQLIGKESIDLRRLSEAMTDFYYRKQIRGPLEPAWNFRPGDVVAAPFQWDGKMYRARVLQVYSNRTMEVVYVDYGDVRTLGSDFVRPLMPEFFRPKFQAIKASLNLSCPGLNWSEETITRFCDLSHCAKWKSLTAEFKGFVNDEREQGRMGGVCIELLDKDRNLGEELIKKGLAARRDTILLAPPVPAYKTWS